MENITMNRFRTFTLSAVLVAIVASGGAALYAQGGARGRAAGPGGPGEAGGRRFAAGFALGQLDLSDAQKQQVRDITMRHRDQTQPLMQRLGQAMAAQRIAIETVPVNEAAVRTASQDVAAAQADMAVEQARLHSDVFAVLTVEQQTKAKSLEAQGQARMKERQLRGRGQSKKQV
jgi:Spy/CpxP family protein refolding chaperone